MSTLTECCRDHVDPTSGTCDKPAVGWCLNSAFDGCEPCCDYCPDYDWSWIYPCFDCEEHPDMTCNQWFLHLRRRD